MRTVLTWTDRGLGRAEGGPVTVYDMTFRPDGAQLVVAAGLRVLVYDTTEGDVVRALKGHKATVYCVGYSPDGKRFASGGADNTVVIWKNSMEGMLKYTHNTSIQCLAFNPVTLQLCSCSCNDFGLWSPDQKSVAKTKVPARVLCCAWSTNGQLLALGHANGLVSIRNKDGVEQTRIDRTAPVWCLAWNPVVSDEQGEVLAVGDWSRKLSFLARDGTPAKGSTEKTLSYDPCSLSYVSNGEYMVIGGSDKKVSLLAKDGTYLSTVTERDDWVWTCKPRPKQNHVAVGDNGGTVSLVQMVFSTVHGLFQDRYAYREFMTDVVIQHLATDKKVRVHCREHVKKIAVYRDRLAVQLPGHILVYELTYDDEAEELRPKLKWKIVGNLDCFLLVVASNHLVLCQERKLQLYNFKGVKEREWGVESTIRYVKIAGGPPGREGMVVGLKNGLILQVFLDNAFQIPLIRQTSSVRCLDLSASRKKLAVVDENSQCLVYDLTTKSLLYVEPNASSVAWNADFEDMLAFSGNGVLNIKAGSLPAHQQKMQGFVVGFRGSKLFCLHVYSMQTIDVPQSATMYRYLERKEFENAYAVACLGVTEADWRLLAMEALRALSLQIATKAFTRIKDLKYIQLIQRIDQSRKLPDHNDLVFLGDIAAFEGKYKEAADYYVQSGNGLVFSP